MRKRERKKKDKRGIKRERKLNQLFQEHVVMGLWWPQAPPPSASRPATVMASTFRASRQPPLSQNPAYAPDLGCIKNISACELTPNF